MTNKFWVSRVCPECGEEISLDFVDLRKNCDLEGNLTIRCPICKMGKIKYSVSPPLTQREIMAKAILG